MFLIIVKCVKVNNKFFFNSIITSRYGIDGRLGIAQVSRSRQRRFETCSVVAPTEWWWTGNCVCIGRTSAATARASSLPRIASRRRMFAVSTHLHVVSMTRGRLRGGCD